MKPAGLIFFEDNDLHQIDWGSIAQSGATDLGQQRSGQLYTGLGSRRPQNVIKPLDFRFCGLGFCSTVGIGLISLWCRLGPGCQTTIIRIKHMMLSDMHVFELLSYSRLNSFWDTYMYLNRRLVLSTQYRYVFIGGGGFYKSCWAQIRMRRSDNV